MSLILSCEHASGKVPDRYAHAFASRAARAALATHRGVDLGAANLARDLSKALGEPVLSGRFTRLLIDLNRSPGHQALFSEWSRRLPPADIERLKEIHAAHWREVGRRVERSRGQALHMAVHTFTPVLNGDVRNFDVGLLYDPARKREVEVAERLRATLLERGFLVRRNAPYRGVADCLPTALRRMFPESRYAGFELEVNQDLLWHQPNVGRHRRLLDALHQTLRAEQRRAR